MGTNFQFSIFPGTTARRAGYGAGNFQTRAAAEPPCGFTLSCTSESKGFTLIELMVSVTLFIVVMLVAVGALLALVDANKKARALESVINNLNVSLDGMVRAIRMGSLYNCGGSSAPNPATGADCYLGLQRISFAPYGSDPSDDAERWTYYFSDGQIFRIRDGITSAITAPEVSISEMDFYVSGTKVRDIVQPKVVLVVKGEAGARETKSTFYIQATAVQRTLDP